MRWADIPFRPTRTRLRRFGVVACLVAASLAGWQAYCERWTLAESLAGLAALLAVLAAALPQALRPLFVAMMVLAFPLNWLTTRIVLALVFYGIFTPLGLWFRLIGRDPLARRFPSNRSTYWTDKPGAASLRSYFRQS